MKVPPTDAVILTVAAGNGHLATANALSGYLERHGCRCAVLETFKAISPFLGELQRFGNDLATKSFPGIYGALYRNAEKKRMPTDDDETPGLFYAGLADRLGDVLSEYRADFIVCTQIFSAQMVSLLKRQMRLEIPAIGIITDFTVHPFWEETTDLDWFVTATPLLANQFLKKGLPVDRMLPFGIPIDERFALREDPVVARRKLGLDPHRFTILLLGGGGGHLDMARIVRELDRLEPDFQILAVAGRNRPLLRRLKQLQTRKTLHSFGFVDRIDRMMDASDCVITKPGGLTVSECLAKGLPMILQKPIPGQEERNREFLLNHGLAMAASETFPLEEALFHLLSDPIRMESMRRDVAMFARPNATRDLGRFLLSGFEEMPRLQGSATALEPSDGSMRSGPLRRARRSNGR